MIKKKKRKARTQAPGISCTKMWEYGQELGVVLAIVRSSFQGLRTEFMGERNVIFNIKERPKAATISSPFK